MKTAEVEAGVLAYFNHLQYLIVPNCYFGGGEMDLLLISKSRQVTEVEIKVSLSDWQNDVKKDKWKSEERSKVSRFFYAVPYDLVGQIPSWVPASAGILVVSPTGGVTVWKRAKKVSKYRVSRKEVSLLMRRIYCRYWAIRTLIKDRTKDIESSLG